MSLINNIAVPATVSGKAFRKKYSVNAAELARGGAFTTVDIVLDTLPAGSIIRASRIKHSAPVVGASVSASTARLFFGDPGVTETALNAAATDVFAAVSATDSTTITGVTNVISPLALTAQPKLFMRVTSTGANLSVVTAGTIDATVDYVSMSTL